MNFLIFSVPVFALIQIRYAHTRRPIYHIRQTSLRQQSLETPFCSLYRAQTPHPTTQAQGAKGWAHGALWGLLGLFRNYSEWKAIPSERSSRMEGHPKGAVLGHLRVALLHVANVLRGPTTQAQGAKGWGPWFMAPLIFPSWPGNFSCRCPIKACL